MQTNPEDKPSLQIEEQPLAETQSKSPSSLHTFPLIENIEFIELLGSGAMSSVYKARQKLLDRIVAVKVLSGLAFQNDDDLQRFQK